MHNRAESSEIFYDLRELENHGSLLEILTFTKLVNIFDLSQLKELSYSFVPELIILDAPYGDMTQWVNGISSVNDYELAINNLQKSIELNTFCILICQEKKLSFDIKVQQIQKFKIGKRIIRFLRLYPD